MHMYTRNIPSAEQTPIPTTPEEKQQALAAGVKYDLGKPRMSLWPRAALEGVAKVLAYGANKYSTYNWRKGMKWSRLTDAALRHIAAFTDGENLDPETALTHIDHAICDLAFLSEYIAKGMGTDDRFCTVGADG